MIYAVSGIAVNHIEDWNPNYAQSKTTLSIDPHRGGGAKEDALRHALKSLNLEEPRSSFRPDPSTLQLFYDGTTYAVDLPTGTVIVERVRERPVLFEFNQLHLNRPKRLWTCIADLYAVALIVVAVTGLLVLKGKYGITRRGAWLTGIGVLVPAVYWIYYLSLPR